MSKPDHAPGPLKPPQAESQHIPTPGTVLVAFTSSLACWLLTGIIGYISPSVTFQDDMTIMTVFLWVPQAIGTVYLIFTAGTRGWSSPAATLSATIVGASMMLLFGLCWAEWGNVATYAFWVAVGIYSALGIEAKFGVAKVAERRIGVLLDS